VLARLEELAAHGDDEFTERNEVFLLVDRHGGLTVVREHIEDTAPVQSDTATVSTWTKQRASPGYRYQGIGMEMEMEMEVGSRRLTDSCP
jgi:hypothetical protein